MTTFINPISRNLETISISELAQDQSRIIYDVDSIGIIINRVHNIILWYNLIASSFECYMGNDGLLDVTVTNISATDKALIQAL